MDDQISKVEREIYNGIRRKYLLELGKALVISYIIIMKCESKPQLADPIKMNINLIWKMKKISHSRYILLVDAHEKKTVKVSKYSINAVCLCVQNTNCVIKFNNFV